MRSFFEPISVILPAKNAGKTIRSAVYSTLTSMHANDELIVVLDASDNETFAKLETILDSRLQVHRLDQLPTLVRKLNFGIEQSKNNIVARMDADDICAPWRFKVQRSVLRDETIQVVASTYIAFGAALRPFPLIPQLPLPLENSDIVDLLVDTNPIAHPTVMFRKSLVLELGGYRDSAAEDLDLWLRVAVAGHRIRRTALPTLFYRFSSQSLSRKADFTKRVASDTEIIRLRKVLSYLNSTNRGSLEVLPPVDRWRKKLTLNLARLNLRLNN